MIVYVDQIGVIRKVYVHIQHHHQILPQNEIMIQILNVQNPSKEITATKSAPNTTFKNKQINVHPQQDRFILLIHQCIQSRKNTYVVRNHRLSPSSKRAPPPIPKKLSSPRISQQNLLTIIYMILFKMIHR